jgi:hypothetical protein
MMNIDVLRAGDEDAWVAMALTNWKEGALNWPV